MTEVSAMAGSSHFIWVPLLLSCVAQASDHRNAYVDDILSHLPIDISEFDPKNINITTIISKNCIGIQEHLTSLSKQLQDSTLQTRQLANEAVALKAKVRLLEVQLSACRLTTPAVSGCYHTELQNRLKQLLDMFDDDTFLILKVIRLSGEVATLQQKINLVAANATETSAATRLLQKELQEKLIELNAKKQLIGRANANAALIFEIISLQNEIWVLGQEGGPSDQMDNRIQAQQEQLNNKIKELRDKKDTASAMLEMISIDSKIALIEKLIRVYSKKTKSNISEYQRQWREKSELLKRKISQLNKNETDKEITQVILDLQMELERLRFLLENIKKTTDVKLKVLKENLDAERKRQEVLQKLLEESEYAQAQIIIKIITIMKDLRETRIDETSPTNPATLLALLQEKERDYIKAQAEIRELQRKLQLNTEECSGLEKKITKLKTNFELRIAELNQLGDSKTALILQVINLQNEIRTLRDLIFATQDSELQRQLSEKQEQLKLKTAEVERLIANPRTILTIISLQNEIWDLQNAATNESISDRIKELQTRVNGLISEVDSADGTTQLTLKILTLQNQVEHLQKQLLDHDKLNISQVTELKNDLKAKMRELQGCIDELTDRNQMNARLIVEITNLHSELRNLEEQRHNDNATFSLVINNLKEELKEKQLENSRNQSAIRILKALLESIKRERNSAQSEVKELQKKLQIMSDECTGLEERYNQTKTEFEQMIEKLKRGGESKAALVLNLINLHAEVKTLTDLIATTKEKDPELQRQLEKKQEELKSKNAELQRLIANPRIILKIIQLQSEIWDLQRKDTNGTARDKVEELQERVEGQITELSNNGDENIKLALQIITLQSQVDHLQRLLSNLSVLKNTEVTQLTDDLTSTKNQLQKYVNELKKNNQTNAHLILRITDLTSQLRKLELEKQNESNTMAATIFNLKEQLKIKVKEHSEDQEKIKALEDKLNQNEAKCSSFQNKLKALQVELDDKITELLSKSDTVTSLAVKISTLNLQLEESKKQLKNTESLTKINELQEIIDKKTKELAKKTQELKERSPQAQRLLHIIAIQNEIEKYVTVTINDTDYSKIRALEDRLTQLIDGIQDEENENTKLTFKVLAQQDEIERLKRIEEAQKKAYSDKIAGLQNELERIRNEISEKTRLLNSSDIRITNLSFQIMDLHKKLKPLEEEIAELKEGNAEKLKELQKRLNLAQRQLQDSELQLNEADAKNFQLIMEISALRSQLTKITKPSEKTTKELKEKVQTQEAEIKKLESTNSDLKEEVRDLKNSCNNPPDCTDVQMQLQQSQEELNRLHQQLQDKDAKIRQLQEESREQAKITDRLQKENNNLEKQFQKSQALNDHLQKQLSEKDALLNQLQTELDGRTTDYDKLQEDYNKLQNEKNTLEERVEDLQDKLTDKEDRTIYPRKMTLDPNTAHPRIVLSAGNTEMSTADELQNVPDNPERFDKDLAVLGATGFSRGRQYWEVSVAGKLCYHIGMASESARRKGIISYSPENGYWTIVLTKQGQLRAFDNRKAIIGIQTQPLRLGILLDYRNGQISFYDASTRVHLYSFAGQSFSNKIYPFINFCVEDVGSPTPIVLLTPGSVDWIK